LRPLFQRVSLLLFFATALAGCGGSVNTTPNATPTPTPIIPSAVALSFSGAAAQTFTVSEPGYSGTFVAVSSNPGVVTVSQNATPASDERRAQATTTVATFTVTPVGGGTATITITDQDGHSITITVSVTSGTFVPESLH
jgi:hypothetical protein